MSHPMVISAVALCWTLRSTPTLKNTTGSMMKLLIRQKSWGTIIT